MFASKQRIHFYLVYCYKWKFVGCDVIEGIDYPKDVKENEWTCLTVYTRAFAKTYYKHLHYT